ncbi:MAG: PAS domain-containing sensor histidine kinase [Desulfuromonadales bacterium]|nr:PAS domain-containing sensor histidine kinase [Desulfuromonadales bacterium]
MKTTAQTSTEQTSTEHILASSPAILYACKAHGDFGATFVTSNITTLLGFTREECLENPNFWRENIHPDDQERVFSIYPEIYQRGHHLHEYRFRTKGGDYLWILDEVRLIRDVSGDPLEIVGSWLDITSRKKMEEDLRDSARLKTEFIATASHELRTPLSVAAGYAELLLQNNGFNLAERREYLTCILDKMHTLERIVDELLDVNRIESGRTICLDCCQVRVAAEVRKILVQMRRESSQHHFTCQFEDEQIELYADQGKLVQVLENLIGNAVKFSPRGGEIKVIGVATADQYHFTISDQGVGIRNEHRDRVFDLFYRVDSSDTAARGMGLGLHLVKKIIEAHNGRIWVTGNKDQGCSFHFTLPLSRIVPDPV